MRALILCDDCRPDLVVPLLDGRFGIEIQGFYNPNEESCREETLARYNSILPLHCNRYLHAPFWEITPGSANRRIAEVARYYLDYAWSLAIALGCSGVIVHNGFVPNTSSPVGYTRRAIAFWQDFFASHPEPMQVFLENQAEWNPDVLIGVVDGCGDARLAVNLDVGHAHCYGKIPVVDWIERLGSRIGYVHLHQNFGEQDEHLGLFHGTLPVREVLLGLSRWAPDAHWALECCTEELSESLERFLRGDWGDFF